MKKYNFWGFEHADVHAVNDEYKGIDTPYDLYDALSEIWCAKTCAPRMRQNWTKENKTLGQCSITAFLAQDIFGGKVYGILRHGGIATMWWEIRDLILPANSSGMKCLIMRTTRSSSGRFTSPRKRKD